MRARGRLVGSLVALLGACGSDAPPPAPDLGAGAPDAAPVADAGPAPDAGVGPDGGPAPDAGAGCDSDEGCPFGPCVRGRCVACLAGPDCDGDGLPDPCAIAAGRAPDCDDNGRPDACDLDDGAVDCDGSGVPNACELLRPRCTLTDERGFVRYLSGGLPVVITAPHGGDLRPADLSDRTDPGPLDVNTRELAEAIDAALFARTGLRPHRVVVDLHRDKLDANRFVEEAAQGDPGAEAAWRAFHRLTDAARHAVQTRHGAGLLLDIHGLSASRPANELGVLLSGTQLTSEDARLRHPVFALESSLRAAVRAGRADLPGLLRGPGSLGARLVAAGFPTVPSPSAPDPGVDAEGRVNPFFSGGYITLRHGSHAGGTVDAVQIETMASVRNSGTERQSFAATLAEALEALFPAVYGQPLGARTRVRLLDPGPAWAGEQVELGLVRTPPLDGPLTVELVGLGASTEARFAAGARAARVSLALSAVRPGRHPLRVAGTASVAAGPGLDLEVLDPEDPPARLELWPERPALGARVRVRLARDRPGPARPRARVAVSGARLRPSLELGLAEGATVAEAFARLEAVGPGGRVVELGLGALELRARVEDPGLGRDLELWLDGAAPAEDRAAQRHPVRELPGPLARALDGPRAPALELDGFADRVWVEGVRYDGSAGYSLSLWFRADADRPDDGFRYVLSHGRLSQRSSLNVYLTGSGRLRTALRGADDGYAPAALDAESEDLRDGAWHHYALVVRPGPEATVYLDGAPAASAPRGHPMGRPRTGLHLGGRYDLSVTRELDGAIDELEVWRRPLEPAEIRARARR